MIQKKIKTVIKLIIPAGEATPAPPIGPALGQHGLPIMDFVKAFNDRTAKEKGSIIPVVITVFEDRTFSFVTKKPPVAEMIKKVLQLNHGSQKPGQEPVGSITNEAVRKIAEEKLPDLNTNDIEAAIPIVKGTARSMGIAVEE